MFMDNAYNFHIFLCMGFPTLLTTTDQGGEFRSNLDEEMKILRIDTILLHFITYRYLHKIN